MSSALFKAAYEGAVIATSYAQILLEKAIKDHGADTPVKYPDTAYRLPVITALSGEEVNVLGDLPPILNRIRTSHLREELTFDNAKMAGEATHYAADIIEALRYLHGARPESPPWTGFLPDPILRKFGVPLVDNTIPGVAVIIGKARSSKEAAKLIKSLQSKGMMIFLVNEIIEQLLEENVKLGIDYIAFPLGNFTQAIHAVNFAYRAGLAFGGIKPGQRQQQLDYQARRVLAFVLALGELDEVRVAAELGAIGMGFPVITDQVVEEIPDWFVSEPDYDKMVKLALELRGIKIKIVDIPVPITVGPAFEGETIRRADTYLEFGGGKTTAFELVRMVGPDDIEDGKITVIGPEITDVKEGDRLPLGIMVNIYGRKMQEDFEGVLERRIHYFVNYGEGLWHVAQRDLAWVRIGKNAAAAGLKIRDIGEILIAKFKSDYPAIVDRVQVTIYTDQAKVDENIKIAREKYAARDARLKGLTDESVDTFYSCILCQSFAPNHVCIVTPERVGLCGAVSWLDAKASNEITPTGPNQPIAKGTCLDEVKGMWQNVNEYLYNNSHHTLEEVNLYTLLDRPMTSCGCFEAIMAILPEANGIMITTREFGGDTPCGMSFSTLAGSVGGGLQSPGFMGIGRRYIVSNKFIPADGGLGRIVWMPKELKEYLRADFIEQAKKQGLGEDFLDKIADESIGTAIDEVLPFLEEKGHPALTMDPLM
ncbi:acetyl-CoA decarbonylase/synthase complex subunit alpha/beta [Acetonema longum]|uniref:CO-methylating acetyl-CoA synthase n=1 Tax=Acetonema longum DSM 6540 TaxID=1009370 RepID=F7NGT3_9FIRM|nr:acetyl-CoA decarbonylase/synthase complex subunit alpha/beta [Acetonema longum]EGO64664.1 bifunctional acetyl-CoA decarbonylase/synthase complex subunit alpha/beta [Acetonema longum DSM 6540]